MDLTTAYDHMAVIATVAGRQFLEKPERDSKEKSNAKDFATVSDIKAQHLIEAELKHLFPDAQVLSEEHDEAIRRAMYEPDFTGFVIDPIDGTFNFKRDMRESAVSIGYIADGKIAAGVVYDPYKDELYGAVKGQGATRNGETIYVSKQQEITGASIATSNSYDDAAMVRNLKRHLAIYEQSGTMPWTSCPGSGVLIMAYIACGRFDAYHHNGLKPWDNAAAFLIIREAGGVVQTLAGEEASFTSHTVLTGNPEIVGKLRDMFDKLGSKLLV